MVSVAGAAHANAAEIRVLATNATKPMLTELASGFERATGHRVTFRFEGSAVIQEEILRGDPFDLVVSFGPNLDAIGKAGKLSAEPPVRLARSGLGMVVRTGLPLPDIRTVEGFRAALVAAPSVAYTARGASGVHFVGVLDRLGIRELVQAKSKTRPTGPAAEFVTKGEADLAVQQMSELIDVPGTQLVGPFPPEVDLVSVVLGGIAASSAQSEVASGFLRHLATPEAAAVFTAKGMPAN